MITPDKSAPHPDLRILDIETILPHETHDSQRSFPLIATLKKAEFLTNPPIVAPMGEDDERFVVLDGANRTFSFRDLGYRHLLVQVAPYDAGYVDLGVWQHVVSNWSEDAFKEALYELEHVHIKPGWDHTAVAQILLHDGSVLGVHGENETPAERNSTLRAVVSVYQRTATLSRTALTDPTVIWSLYPDAVAVVLFPPYSAEDIITAAREKAFLPPGVSRHIIQGRALKLNFPLNILTDLTMSLEVKNAYLRQWIQRKLTNRAVRYYAESTYQFDE
ncbi:MAG: hypothetical protein AAFV98_16755 [Chloroflexota bacterium]